MSLVPYTNTYTDTDGTIADADDIIAEFDRVSAFINAWADSYDSIGLTSVRNETINEDGNFDIEPAIGLVQAIRINSNIETVNFNIKAREKGDPFRIYMTLRFGSPATRFTVSAPSGSSHIFSVNQADFIPSPTSAGGFFPATVIVTYGTDAVHVQVFAHNDEATAVGVDDILQGVSI